MLCNLTISCNDILEKPNLLLSFFLQAMEICLIENYHLWKKIPQPKYEIKRR